VNLEIGNNGKTKWMVNCKWFDHMVKIVFCQKSTKIPVLAVFWPPVMDRSVEFPFGRRRGARRFPAVQRGYPPSALETRSG